MSSLCKQCFWGQGKHNRCWHPTTKRKNGKRVTGPLRFYECLHYKKKTDVPGYSKLFRLRLRERKVYAVLGGEWKTAVELLQPFFDLFGELVSVGQVGWWVKPVCQFGLADRERLFYKKNGTHRYRYRVAVV